MYRYELHLATADFTKGDRATVSADEAAQRYIAAGYDGVVLTNQWGKYPLLTVDKYKNMPPEGRAEAFLSAYDKLKAAAGKDLTVLLGAEMGMLFCPSDYLVYGITREFIETFDYSIITGIMYMNEFYSYLHARGLMVYQAHPFAPFMRVVEPRLLRRYGVTGGENLDGVEVYTANNAADCNNDFAEKWAFHYAARTISGSDFAHPDSVIGGGIETDERICTNDDLLRILRTEQYRLICGKETRHV